MGSVPSLWLRFLGLILIGELDERLALENLIEVDSRLAGYEDITDAERLAVDPTFRLISSSVPNQADGLPWARKN